MIKECLENSVMESMGRCSDLIWISFGRKIFVINYRNDKVLKSEYALHIQCPFRISKGNDILLGNNDIYEVNEDSLDDEWDIIGNNRFDKILSEKVLPILPLSIRNVSCNDLGDIEIMMDKDITIRVFANSSDNIEEWRFINNNTHEHYVFREE